MDWTKKDKYGKIINPYSGESIEPVSRFETGKWYIQLNLEPQYGRGSGALVLNWEWSERGELGYWETWYDGPHKSFGIGPIRIYWNWG